ncbi:MAG: hypothetical protein AB8H86_00750 [Polyangiales bacterium]
MARVTPVLVILALVTLSALTHTTRLGAMSDFVQGQRYEDLYYLPPPAWLGVMSLGHREALADVVWMKGLVYVGDEFREEGGMRNVFRYANAMIVLDPEFRRAYEWTGVAGLYRPTDSTREEIETTVEFLRLGVDRFPNDGELKWDLGTTLMYELARHLEGEEEEAVRREATEHMVAAARLGAGPPFLALSNATQLLRQGEIDTAIRHLEEMYPLIDNEETQAAILSELGRLRGAAEAEAVQAARESFASEWMAAYPWIPSALYVHLGPRPVVPLGYLPPELMLAPGLTEMPDALP